MGAASGPNARERALAAENEELKAALGEAHVDAGLEEERRAQVGAYEELEVIRLEEGMPTSCG